MKTITKVDAMRQRRQRQSRVDLGCHIVSDAEYRSMKFRMNVLKLITVMSIALCILFGKTYFSNAVQLLDIQDKYMSLMTEYQLLRESYDQMYNDYVAIVDYAEDLETNIASLTELTTELDEQSKSLAASNQEYYERIQVYEQREELFDKYEYAIVRSDGSRTDITYDQLIEVEEFEEVKGVDADLVLSIAMVESQGTEKICNAKSSARGYGQILAGTGEYVYENLMCQGKYDHSYALNGDTNLAMMVYYLEYLGKNNSTMTGVIQGYRGEGEEILYDYMDKINGYLAKTGQSLASLHIP